MKFCFKLQKNTEWSSWCDKWEDEIFSRILIGEQKENRDFVANIMNGYASGVYGNDSDETADFPMENVWLSMRWEGTSIKVKRAA